MLHARAGYRCARPTPPFVHSGCNARPVHTKVPTGDISTTYSYPSRRFTHNDNGHAGKGLPSQAASY